MDTSVPQPEAGPFLQLEPLLDQSDAFNLLIARMAAIQMQDWHVQSGQNGTHTLAYKIRISDAYVGAYVPKLGEPLLWNLETVPSGLNWTPICANGTLADDIIRFKIKSGKYDIYSKKSAEGLMQKLVRDLSVDHEAPVPAQIEYAHEPNLVALEACEHEASTRRERKILHALRMSLQERETQRKVASLAVLLIQGNEVSPEALLALLKRPAHELEEIYDRLEHLAIRLRRGDSPTSKNILLEIEEIRNQSRSQLNSRYEVAAFSSELDVVRIARRMAKTGERLAELDSVLDELFDYGVRERNRKFVDTAYWEAGSSKPRLTWPLNGSTSARLYAQAMRKKDGRTELNGWVSDYLAMQLRVQFKPIGQNRIDLAYAALRELGELEMNGVIESGPAYELQFMCESYEKMCLRLPRQLEKARQGERLDESLDQLMEFMQRRDELLQKISELIGELDDPYVQTPSGASVAQASAKARLALAVLACELCSADMEQESVLMERAQNLWPGAWPRTEAGAYLDLLGEHNTQRAILLKTANDKEGKDRRKELDVRFKEKLDELAQVAKIDADAVMSDYRKTQSHVGYKSGENRRVQAFQPEEMRLRKAIHAIDREIREIAGQPRGEIDAGRFNDLAELRDALTAISQHLHAATENAAYCFGRMAGMRFSERGEQDSYVNSLLFPEYLKSLHYAGLDVLDLIPEMEQLEAQNFRQSELPLNLRIVVGGEAGSGTVPMKVFAENAQMNICFSKFFEFDLGAGPGKNQSTVTPIEEVLYGPRVGAAELASVCGAKGAGDYAAMLDYSVLWPKEYYTKKLNEETLNDLSIQALVGEPEALRGKRVFNNGQWEETLPFTVPKGVRLEPPTDTQAVSNPKAAETLARMRHSYVMGVRMAELTQKLNGCVNREIQLLLQKRIRQNPQKR
ncbi:Uncharacterised protein [uncultured archaeon]|nr:Uncharacterised protein [uncultured archaeon]